MTEHEIDWETLEAKYPWFLRRMMNDNWCFGLLLTGGIMVAITHILRTRVTRDGTLWIDVEMMDGKDIHGMMAIPVPFTVVGAPTSRTDASINAAHIIWAIELADT